MPPYASWISTPRSNSDAASRSSTHARPRAAVFGMAVLATLTWACRVDDPTPKPAVDSRDTRIVSAPAPVPVESAPTTATTPPARARELGAQTLSLEQLTTLAEGGDADAQLTLGAIYYEGEGVEKDHARAATWVRRAADRGHPLAQATMATLYSRGHGVPRDEAEAAAWLRRAAEQGLATAQANLARLFLQGQGVAQDAAEGARWLQRAADQDLPAAQSNLGLLYLRGEGVARDPLEASKWLRLAADAGVADAQLRLGALYEQGRGVERDPVAAWTWYELAASQGQHPAADRRDALAPSLTPGQIEAARAAVRAWKPRDVRAARTP